MDTKQIRKELKEQLGYNTRQVSVSKPHYCSIHFTIRDPKVDQEKVEEFSRNYESISRCEYSGDILSGGNTFVDVKVTDEVEEAWAEDHIEETSIALALVKHAGEDQVQLNEDFFIMKTGYNEVTLMRAESSDSMFSREAGRYWIGDDSARAIAIKMR